MAGLYARRTLVVYRLWFTEPRNTDAVFMIDDVCGHDVIDLFRQFSDEENGLIQLGDSERFLKIRTLNCDSALYFASVQSGRAGVVGAVVNTETAEEEYGYGNNEAGMVFSRFCLSRREGYGYALACIERVPNDAGSTAVLRAFEKYFRSKKIQATIKREHIQREQALKAFKGIEDIEVRRYTRSKDRSDGLTMESKYISHIAKHKRGRLFPINIMHKITEDKGSLTAVLGIPEEYEGREDVRIRLKGWDGSSRLFVLGDDLNVPLVELLNDSGEKPLSDGQFLNRCSDVTSALYEQFDRMI